MFTSRFYFPAALRAGDLPSTRAAYPAGSRLTRVSHFGRLRGPTYQLAPAGVRGVPSGPQACQQFAVFVRGARLRG